MSADMLSRYFSVAEYERSTTAHRLGWRNEMTTQQRAHARWFCQHTLDQLREHFGRALVINSGYRSRRVNRRIGGARRSLHLHLGCDTAADIECPGVPNVELAMAAQRFGRYSELILELPSPDDDRAGWVHIGTSARIDGRRTLTRTLHGYEHGIVAP